MSENSVHTRAAYVLFYRRRDSVVEIPKYLVDTSEEKQESMDTVIHSRYGADKGVHDDVRINEVEEGAMEKADDCNVCPPPLSYTDMEAVD